jgi:hypothetical protein
MPTDNKEVREFEEKFKSGLFDKIGKMYSEQAKLISQIQKTDKYGELESDLPNIAITLNNKLNELQHEFQDAGISIYSKKHEEQGIVSPSYTGEAIMIDLVDYTNKGIQKLADYDKTMSEIVNKKNEQVQVLEEASPLRKFFRRIKNLFVSTKQDDMLYTQEEADKINSYLLKYIDIDNQLWNYNLRDNVINSIAKSFRIKGYSVSSISNLLKSEVIPDLQKLGLSDLITELKKTLIDEYKKDLPNSEIYQVRQQDERE